jgi:glycosyltransferase involved in cell wall biosynthesis
MDSPDISIIIPVFNRASLLRRAIESALGDEGVKVEVVVVDDGSTDVSAQVAQSFGPPVKVLRQANAGPSAARNRGFAESRGTYVRFLDSDDWLLPGANTMQMGEIEHSGADVCYGDWRNAFGNQPGQDVRESELQSMGSVDDPVETLLDDKWNPPFCYLLRREVVEAIGGWDENRDLIGTEDFDFILRIAIHGSKFLYLKHDIGRYFHHSEPRTSRGDRLEWCNAKRHILEKGIQLLDDKAAWTDRRKRAVANTVVRLAKNYYGLDRMQFGECLTLITDIDPEFCPPGVLYPVLVKIMGYERTEALLEIRRRLQRANRRKKLPG